MVCSRERYGVHLSNYAFGRYPLLLFLADPYLAKKECIICRNIKFHQQEVDTKNWQNVLLMLLLIP